MDRTKVVAGNTAVLVMDGLSVQVKILDTKQAFGRLDVLIEPVAGSGQRWVQCDRLKEGEKMRTPEEIVCAVLSDPENWYISEDEMNMLDAEDSFWDSAPPKFIEVVGPTSTDQEGENEV